MRLTQQQWRATRAMSYSSRSHALALAALLPWLVLRRAEAEERLDFKTLYYKEDGDRMKVFAPSVLLEHEFTPSLMIKLEGIYNAISGATPTGAPPAAAAAAKATTTSAPASPGSGVTATAPAATTAPRPSAGGGEGESERDDRRLVRMGNTGALRSLPLRPWAKAGATPAPVPAPAPAPTPSAPGTTTTTTSAPATTTPGTTAATPASTAAAPAPSNKQPVPTANSSDHRYGLVLELVKTWEQHTLAAQFAYSTESDYNSKGLALRDAIDFNQKNTTLLLGVSANHDQVEGYYQPDTATKNSYDGMIGVTQLLDAKTFITANLTLGTASGYLTDPYKVVELNGALVPEKRPDSRTTQIAYVALTRFIEQADACAEVSYRY